MSTTEEQEHAQEQRAAAAQARPAAEPARVDEVLGEMLASLSRAREAQARKRLVVIESDCPDCVVDSASARHCAFRAWDFCKHAGELQRRALEESRRQRLMRANVPADYWPRIIAGSSRDLAAVAAARRIAAGEGKLAVFAGGVGSGKTHGAAVALADRGGFFCSASALDPFGKEANELLEHCAEVSLLVLDDAGAGRSTSDVARPRLEALVCSRWDAGRATIVTTNLAQKEFWPLYGGPVGRVWDRLRGDPVGWVRCLEESQRGAL